jgi:DUF1680 family protein
MTMDSARRDFLKASATTTAALTLGSLVPDSATAATTEPAATATGATIGSAAPPRDTAALAHERAITKAHPVPLGRVRLTGGPLKHAQDLTREYLLALDPDRMLAYYRERAGLAPKAKGYTGWDGNGRNLTGHIAGHHLSGVSLMYQATGDARFKERADYIVRELAEVQKKSGDGYVGALDGLREAFARLSKGEIKSGSFDLNGLWSPWYTLHKTYAGLRDAFRHTGNAQALQVEIAFAAWAEGVLKPLSDEQVQKMLLTEFGGMNEVMADLYADTGDARWLTLSHRFEHHAVTQPLKRHQDNLSGKHGNCQIPKLLGSAARYGYTGEMDDIVAATFFWDRVVRHHSYASGGHGLNEYWGPPDVLSTRVDGRAAETCNVYNMLKLSRRLFSLRPDAAYADFHERALFNHILASIDPNDARTSYMVPVGRGEQQEYQNMQRDFTCCVGSGMESHALHGLGVWYESRDTIWLNLFVPSTAEFTLGKAKLALETSFPDGDSATVTVTLPAPKAFTLAVRRPFWAGDGFTIAVNGTPIPQPKFETLSDPVAGGRAGGIGNESTAPSSSYVNVTRTWKSGDTVSLVMPKALHLEPTPDDPRVTAIVWGPLALAGDMGPRLADIDENAQTTPRTPGPDAGLDFPHRDRLRRAGWECRRLPHPARGAPAGVQRRGPRHRARPVPSHAPQALLALLRPADAGAVRREAGAARRGTRRRVAHRTGDVRQGGGWQHGLGEGGQLPQRSRRPPRRAQRRTHSAQWPGVVLLRPPGRGRHADGARHHALRGAWAPAAVGTLRHPGRWHERGAARAQLLGVWLLQGDVPDPAAAHAGEGGGDGALSGGRKRAHRPGVRGADGEALGTRGRSTVHAPCVRAAM